MAPPDPVAPFYFGEARLYGCLHEAAGVQRGVVICHPCGSEYIAIHRAARQLASRVARAGLPTLRFDYSGTGDSAGDLQDVGLEGWTHEVGAAVDELRRRTSVPEVSLIGIRLGASLAYLAAAGRKDVDRLALWDPVLRGSDYLTELRKDHRRMLRVAHVRPRPLESGEEELLGFRLPAALRQDLERLDLEQAPVPAARRFLLFDSGASPDSWLAERLRATARAVETRAQQGEHPWRWEEDVARVHLPHAAVSTIAKWIATEDTR